MRLTRRGRKRLIVLLTGLVVVSAGLVVFLVVRGSMRDREVAAARASGLRAYAEGQYAVARDDLEYVYDALREDEADAEVAYALADIIARAGRASDDDAYLKDLLGKVQRWDPDNLDARERLLDVALTRRQPREVVNAIEGVLQLEPDHVRALETMIQLPEEVLSDAELEKILGDLGVALERSATRSEMLGALLDTCMAREPDRLSWRVFALRALELGGATKDELRARAEAWCAEAPAHAGLQLVAARTAMDDGDIDGARAHLLAATQRPIEDRALLANILATAEVLSVSYNAAAAQQDDIVAPLIERLRSESPRAAWIDLAVIEQAWRSQRFEAAQELAEDLEPDGPLDRFETLRWRVVLADERGDAAARAVAVGALAERLEDTEVETAGVTRDDVDFAGRWLEAFRAHVDPDSPPADELDAWASALTVQVDDTTAYLYARALDAAAEPNEALSVYLGLARSGRVWSGLNAAIGRVELEIGNARAAFIATREALLRGGDRSSELALTLIEAWLQGGDAGGFTPEQILRLASELHDATGWHARVSPAFVTLTALVRHSEDGKALARAAMDDPETHGDVLAALVPVSNRFRWGLEEELARVMRDRPISVDGLETITTWLMDSGQPDAAVRIAASALERSFARDEDRAAAERLALRLRLATDAPGARDDVLAAIPDTADVPWLAAIVDAPTTWARLDVAAACIDRLRALCGPQVARVRLGEARLAYARQREDGQGEAAAAALRVVEPIARDLPQHRVAQTLVADLSLAAYPPNPRGALDALDRVRRLRPRDADVVRRIVRIAIDAGDRPRAENAIAAFSRAGGTELRTMREAAELYLSIGDRRAALDLYERLALLGGTDDDRIRLATLKFESGDVSGAERLLDGLTAMGNAAAIEAAAGIAVARGDWDRAMALLDRMSGSEAARATRAAAFERRHGRAARAAQRLRMVLEAHGEDADAADAWLELARSLLGRPDDAEALREAESALVRAHGLVGDDARLRSALASLLLALSSLAPERAERLEALAADLEAAAPYMARALALARSPSTPDAAALGEARKLIETWPDVVALWRLAIDLHALAGDLEQAVNLAADAIGRFPRDGALRRTHASLLLKQDRSEDAAKAARAWMTAVPMDRYDAVVMLAAIELDQDRDLEAWNAIGAHTARLSRDWTADAAATRIWLEAALRAAPWGEVAPLVGALLESPQRVDDALGAWERIPATKMGDWVSALEPYVDAERLLERLAARATAEPLADERVAILLAMQRLAPDDPAVLNNLANAMVTVGGSCPAAVEHAERAAGLLPGEAAVHDTLARALLCAGRVEKAEAEAREAVRLGPEQAACHVTLAEVLKDQGDSAGARQAARQARELLQAGARRDDLRRRIAKITA